MLILISKTTTMTINTNRITSCQHTQNPSWLLWLLQTNKPKVTYLINVMSTHTKPCCGYCGSYKATNSDTMTIPGFRHHFLAMMIIDNRTSILDGYCCLAS